MYDSSSWGQVIKGILVYLLSSTWKVREHRDAGQNREHRSLKLLTQKTHTHSSEPKQGTVRRQSRCKTEESEGRKSENEVFQDVYLIEEEEEKQQIMKWKRRSSQFVCLLLFQPLRREAFRKNIDEEMTERLMV